MKPKSIFAAVVANLSAAYVAFGQSTYLEREAGVLDVAKEFLAIAYDMVADGDAGEDN